MNGFIPNRDFEKTLIDGLGAFQFRSNLSTLPDRKPGGVQKKCSGESVTRRPQDLSRFALSDRPNFEKHPWFGNILTHKKVGGKMAAIAIGYTNKHFLRISRRNYVHRKPF
jgi:hypothetical protein